jgi:Family of unknown function (DUF5715)
MKNKNKRSRSKIFIFTLTGIGLGFLMILGFTVQISNKKTVNTNKRVPTAECDHIRFPSAPISPSNELCDRNEIHLLHAQRNGVVPPFKTDSSFNAQIVQLVRKSRLVKVTENNFYQLKSLTYSQPYLIPEAVDMLNEIGVRFQARLKEKHYKHFRFRITSLMRTVEMQSKLCHHNRNATKSQTAHLFGTTVDISYKDFYNIDKDTIESSYEAVQALTQTLIAMRMECKFLAVRERKQSCFHITVVVCRPNGKKRTS